MFYIKGNVRKILFSTANSYKVGLFKIKEVNTEEFEDYLNKTITFTGVLPELSTEITYKFFGNIVEHKRYGTQFEVSSYEIEEPTDTDSIILYLSSGIIKGIGYKTAKNIVDKFGLDSIDVIKNKPNDLLSIKGLTLTKINNIHEKIMNITIDNDKIIELTKLGFNSKESINIANNYKYSVEEIINEKIYLLKEEINFIKLDTIYLKHNSETTELRIKEIIKYIINKFCLNKGDTKIKLDSIYLEINKYFKEQLNFESFNYYINKLNLDNEIIILDNYVMLKNYYESEKYAAETINKINLIKQNLKEEKIDKLIVDYQTTNNIDFNDEQINAIKSSLLNNMFILTGGPGTGKTTIIKAIVDIYRRITCKESISDFLLNNVESDDIILLAPTGRSAKKLASSVGLSASTIHKFLKWNKETKSFGMNEYVKSEANLVIIDECSMIDVFLFVSLLKALKSDVKLILVGDVFQLPSIGPGNVLNDLIESEKISKVFLEKIYRTKSDSHLIDFAISIKNQKEINGIDKNYKDLKFIDSSDVDIKEYLKIICIKAKEKFNLDDFQVLAPMYKGENGIDNLNLIMQNIFNEKNANKSEVKIASRIFRKNDKVIQLVNDIDNNVFNGDIGYIKNIIGEKSDLIIEIDFAGNVVKYNREKLDNFTHAYAISIHKSQGSEYENVVVVLGNSFKRMLYNKLLYTAVTRAKKNLILIGSLYNLNIAIKTLYSSDRKTYLKELLQQF